MSTLDAGPFNKRRRRGLRRRAGRRISAADLRAVLDLPQQETLSGVGKAAFHGRPGLLDRVELGAWAASWQTQSAERAAIAARISGEV